MVLAASAIATLAAIDSGSTLGFFAATLVAGLGFGAGFQGDIRTVVHRAEPYERAGVLSVLYIVCYLGMGVPSVVAGVLVVHGGGLIVTARDYTVFVLVLSAAALAGLSAVKRSTQPVTADAAVTGHGGDL